MLHCLLPVHTLPVNTRLKNATFTVPSEAWVMEPYHVSLDSEPAHVALHISNALKSPMPHPRTAN